MSFFKRKRKACLYIALLSVITLFLRPAYVSAENATEFIDSSGTDIGTVTIDSGYIKDSPVRLEVIFQGTEPVLIMSGTDGSVWSRKRQKQGLTGNLAVEKKEAVPLSDGKYSLAVYYISSNEQDVDISISGISGQTVFLFLTDVPDNYQNLKETLLPIKKVISVSSPGVTKDAARALLSEIGAQDAPFTEYSEEAYAADGARDDAQKNQPAVKDSDTDEKSDIPEDIYEKAKKAAEPEDNSGAEGNEKVIQKNTILRIKEIFYSFIKQFGGTKRVIALLIALIAAISVIITVTILQGKKKEKRVITRKDKGRIEHGSKKNIQEGQILCLDTVNSYFNEDAYDIGYIKPGQIKNEQKEQERYIKEQELLIDEPISSGLNIDEDNNSLKKSKITTDDKKADVIEKPIFDPSSPHSDIPAPTWIVKPGETPAWAKEKSKNSTVFF